MSIILGALLGLLVAYICAGYNWLWLWKLRKLPGPGGVLPYYGHVRWGPREAFVHYKYLLHWPKLYGSVFRMYLGQLPYVVVTDPALIEQIGTRQFTSFHDRVPLPLGVRVTKEDREQFDSNIFWAKGKMWSSVRSACEPLFHATSLRSYAPLMHDSIDQWLALLEKKSAGGATVNIIHPMNGLAMSALGKATLGVEFDCQSDTQAQTPLVKAAFYNMDPQVLDATGLWIMFTSMTTPWIRGVLAFLIRQGWLGGEQSKTFAQMEGFLNGSTKALIENYRRASSSDTAPAATGPVVKMPKPEQGLPPYVYSSLKGQAAGAAAHATAVPREGSFIPRLLAAKYKEPGQEPRSLTDQQIVAQAYTLILAGYDSPANAMSHSLYELAKNPDVQQKLIAEVDTLKGRRVEFDDLAKLTYTEATFQETLRLHPAGNPMFSPCRVCTKDTELGGYHIPKGCGIMLNSVGMAYDPRWFPTPQKFKPERHIPGTPRLGPETRPATAHIPFGYGPHGCVGRKYALEEAVFMLVSFFQRFTVALDEKHHPPRHELWARTGITFQPSGGIWLKLTPRAAAAVGRPEE